MINFYFCLGSHYFSDRFVSLACNNDLKTILHDALSIYKSNGVEVHVYIYIYVYVHLYLYFTD